MILTAGLTSTVDSVEVELHRATTVGPAKTSAFSHAAGHHAVAFSRQIIGHSSLLATFFVSPLTRARRLHPS